MNRNSLNKMFAFDRWQKGFLGTISSVIKNIKNFTFSEPKINATYVLTLFLFIAIGPNATGQTTYTFNGPGDWTEQAKWSPSYPGTTIKKGDHVNLKKTCKMNTNVMVDGSVQLY